MRISPSTHSGTGPAVPSDGVFPAPRSFSGEDRRGRPRAPLALPVRVRWLGPFGLETEVTQTLDAGGGGTLISSCQSHQEGSHVWATLPYDARAAATEAEIPGRVAHSKMTPAGTGLTGIAFDAQAVHSTDRLLKHADRRSQPRVPLALFVRVIRRPDARRPVHFAHEFAPWPEDTMTVDVSPRGMLFCTLRAYEPDERLSIALPNDRRSAVRERLARVVRVAESGSDSPLLNVAVEFLSWTAAHRLNSPSRHA